MEKVKKLTLTQLIGITMVFSCTVRSVPTLAINGWTEITYFLVAVIIFAIPISLITAELATGWPHEGGPQVWVKEAMGEKWGFVTAWLLWIQMITGMVMIGTTVGVLLGYVINNYSLAQSNIFDIICVLVAFWGVTLLNIKFDMVKIVGKFGAILGVYIPFVILIIFGITYIFKFGINTTGYLGTFTLHKLIPNFHKITTLTYFSGIMFIFAGIEMSSVYANNVENPKKNYPIAVIISVLVLVILNLIASVTVSNAIPNGSIQLANIMQPFIIYFSKLGIPMFFSNIIACMMLIGVLAQMSAWVLGPSKAMIKVAEEGNLPKIFQKRTERDVPITFLIIQAVIVSIFMLAYIAVPNINSIFFMITITTTILYCVVYILICISVIKLRYSKLEIERPFKIGSKDNSGIWIISILALFGIILTIVVSFIPPSIFKPSQYSFYFEFQIIAIIISILIPLIIYKYRKSSWRKES